MKWSLYLGKVSGIRISVHWTFVILLGWIFILYYQQAQEIREAIMGVVFILSLFICVTLHELGHALTGQRFNIVTKNITLLPIGGVAQMEKLPEKPLQELWVAIAGPMVNVGIAALLFSFLYFSNNIPQTFEPEQFENLNGTGFWLNLFLANIVLAFFNLIPAFPMDGGRILRALLSLKFDRGKATQIAAGVGQIMAIIFVFIGLFSNTWLVLIGIFIYLGAGAEAAFESTKTTLSGNTVKDVLMTKYTKLLPEDTLEKAVALLLDGQEQEFVVAENDRVLGILTRTELIKGLTEFGKDAPVSNSMRKNYLVLDVDMPIQEVYEKLMSNSCSVAPVLDHGELIGIVDKENINELILVKTALAQRQAGKEAVVFH